MFYYSGLTLKQKYFNKTEILYRRCEFIVNFPSFKTVEIIYFDPSKYVLVKQ